MQQTLPKRGLFAVAILSLLLGGCLSGAGMPAGLDYRLVNRIDHSPGTQAMGGAGRQGQQLAMAPDGRMRWIPAPAAWASAVGAWIVPPRASARRSRPTSAAAAVPAVLTVEEQADGFVLPVSGSVLTSGFGMREHPILGGDRLHSGIDLAAAAGTPVRAAVSGTVVTAGWNGGYGNYVRIAHGAFGTAYAHLQGYAPGIEAGTAVDAGDVIGYVGSTGRSTGPHLHFEVLIDDDAIDPMSVLPNRLQVALGAAPRVELARGGR